MKLFNNSGRRCAIAAAVLAALGCAACTQVDDTLGANLVPDDQQMKVGFVTLPRLNAEGSLDTERVKQYVETRLYRTDSIKSSNLGNGYMGTQLNDTLGRRSAGFVSQFQSYYTVPEGYFGYRPMFDSAQMLLSIAAYGRDTLTEQHFAVYEVLSNDYLTADQRKDTLFYLNFDPADPKLRLYDPARKLFTFTLGGDRGPSTTTAVTMAPTEWGRDYIARLMLQKGEYEGDYSIYSTDSLAYWHETFRGLYICPDPDRPLQSSDKHTDTGGIYATKLSSSGFTVYARNREESDPSLIRDTVGMTFYFYDAYSEHGNVSVNTIRRDYADAAGSPLLPSVEQAWESDKERPEVPYAYVEGYGGAITELSLTEAFFDDLQTLLDEENAAHGKEFRTLAFSQVAMSVYFEDADYDWQTMDPSDGFDATRLVEEMNAAPSRLGLYTDYKKLTPIVDYAYLYEKNYNATIAYDGYINRSRGCYVMNVTGYIQGVWNSYVEERDAARRENRPVDMEKVEGRTVYLGPNAYDLFTSAFTLLQGDAADPEAAGLKAPVRFDITYNMVK